MKLVLETDNLKLLEHLWPYWSPEDVGLSLMFLNDIHNKLGNK